MNQTPQVLSREALYWLVLAELLVVLPHLLYLPIWVVGLEGLCLLWWFGILRKRISPPSPALKLLLIAGISGLLYLTQGRLTGLDAAATLLICALILKSLEVQAKRDALVMVFLGFFSVITGFLFENSLAGALYSLIPITVLLVALLSVQSLSRDMSAWRRIRVALGLLLQALPIMLVLFVFFPRIPPLWSMPQPQDKQALGLADQLSPNALNELTQSPATAFRVQFEGQQPSQETLYWRGISFEYFDGLKWTRSGAAKTSQSPAWSPRGSALNYSIIQQPSAQPWLFALDVVEHPSKPGIKMMGDFHLESVRPISRPLLYQLRSWPEAQAEPSLPAARKAALLQLPRQGNEQTRALAEGLKAKHSTSRGLVDAILQKFAQEPFAYSLISLPEGVDAIDQFLFEYRSGFCAHYAQAMTFMLRAAGVPARVVGGYQGGRYNPEAGYWVIRQFDAHAWVEYWIEGIGWQRADPTFQVAPERIQLGVERALESVEQFLPEAPETLRGLGTASWSRQLHWAWDEWEYAWQRWVLNYQSEQQGALLQQLISLWRTHQGILLWWGLIPIAAFVLWMLYKRVFRHQSGSTQRQEWLQQYDALWSALGCPRLPSEGLRQFSERAKQAYPQKVDAISAFARAYEALYYTGIANPRDEQRLRHALKQLRKLRTRSA